MTHKDLITLTPHCISKHDCQTVDARELHEFLGVGRDFPTWIKARIDEYSFEEKQDFVIIPKTGDNPKRGPKFIDYALTLDMAKELCMVEKTAKGKEARRYFIECERALRAKPTRPDLSKPRTKPHASDFLSDSQMKDPTLLALAGLLDHYKKSLWMERKYIKQLRKQLSGR